MRVKRRRQRREDGDGGAENDPQDVAGVREALAVAVEAVARAADRPETDVDAEYAAQRWRMPLERDMAAADAYSLSRAALASVGAACGRQEPTGATEIAELARLAVSVSSGVHDGVRERLEAQKSHMNDVREGGRPIECPVHLSVDLTTVEDPLEARRDSHGGAVPLERNAIGEHYASYSFPLSYTRGKTAAEIFARMKTAVREDIRTRDARRIAALNQQERERKQQLIGMGYLSPDAVVEARFDHLMHRESADPTA